MKKKGSILDRRAPEEDWEIFMEENYQNTLFKSFF